MLRIIAALAVSVFALSAGAQSATPNATTETVRTSGNVLQISPDAPDRYVVVKGDTLWGISSRYLSSPWNWPELWGMNREQVNNPHLIYPGDVLVLDRAAGRLTVVRQGKVVDTGAQSDGSGRLSPKIYEQSNAAAIPSIPVDAIEPFLSIPLAIGLNELDGAPKVVGTQENRVVLGSGDRMFVSGLASRELEWQVYRPGEPLLDPDSREVLGHEAVYLGDARLERPGDPALLLITRSKLEIAQGDRLVVSPRSLLTNYTPRKAPDGFSGKVAAIHGKGTIGGQYSVITLNRGRTNGLEVGHVVALNRAGRVIGLRTEEKGYQEVPLPEERYALAFVFRTFDRIAYAVVLHAKVQVSIGDIAVSP